MSAAPPSSPIASGTATASVTATTTAAAITHSNVHSLRTRGSSWSAGSRRITAPACHKAAWNHARPSPSLYR